MEPVAGADGLTGGLYVQPLDVGKIPGVDEGVNYIQDYVGKGYDLVMDVLAPYQAVDPLYVLVLLYIAKFLITMPLANLFKSEKNTCANPDKFCGNTFNTFLYIVNTLIALMLFVFYVRITAGGFKMAGFFSVRGYLPIVTTGIIVLLSLWALKATRFLNPKFTSHIVGALEDESTSLWHLIQANAWENMDVLSKPFKFSENPWYSIYFGEGAVINSENSLFSSLPLIIVCAAVLTLAGRV